ncbi:IclR family transcriptional regulator [Nocardioides immobilis]|uniref:IclR family transcriptional regulator n=2 Tax=Nocardioides immobilis TaxID=2049295 RepID=A0A417Y6W6_9ACTN|nr:IclR family transcriptional regulator [Nocardioides immobilis]
MRQTERRIASVSKAFDALTYIAGSEVAVSARDLSQRMGQPLATTYHLLNTLVLEGAILKGPDRRYRLGPRIGYLGAAYLDQGEPTDALVGPLRELAAETGETAYLSVWRHDEIAVVATAEGSHAVRVAQVSPGTCGHAHARASGKLLLAHASASARRRYLDTHELEPMTPNTITNLDDLNRELAVILDRGYSTDHEEFVIDVSCVAAPIMVAGHTLGALTVSCPTARFVEHEQSLTQAVKVAANRAGRALDSTGHREA